MYEDLHPQIDGQETPQQVFLRIQSHLLRCGDTAVVSTPLYAINSIEVRHEIIIEPFIRTGTDGTRVPSNETSELNFNT